MRLIALMIRNRGLKIGSGRQYSDTSYFEHTLFRNTSEGVQFAIRDVKKYIHLSNPTVYADRRIKGLIYTLKAETKNLIVSDGATFGDLDSLR